MKETRGEGGPAGGGGGWGGGPAGGAGSHRLLSPTKEMMQPCLLYVHAISLFLLIPTVSSGPTKEMLSPV